MKLRWLRRPLLEIMMEVAKGSERAALIVPLLFPALARMACTRAGLGMSILPDANEGFDLAHYEASLGRQFRSVEAALFHYLMVGSRRGSRPRVDFDPADYRRRNADMAIAGYEPFAHYLHFGQSEGRCGTVEADTPDDSLLPLPDIAQMLRHPVPNAWAATIDVVIPVYGSRRLVLRTIDSVLAARATNAYELIVVDDASPDPILRRELQMLADAGHLTLVTNPYNIGFVATANRGFALHAGRDVVLLNSDTQVYGDWLDRLIAALRDTPRTGTASPLSNAATILSYPISLRDNHRLIGMDFAALDRLCAQLGQRPVELPTALGFCMAIKRTCLDEVGPLDVAQFGRGYGEENDFSLRAIALGWRHVAATDVFVWHRGGASFGMEREVLIATAQATLERLHPGYAAAVQRFIGRDPLQPVREALDTARVSTDPRLKVLHVDEEAEGVAQAIGDQLEIRLTPDIGPFFEQYRFMPRGIPMTPNLPRISRGTAPRILARILKSLAIQEVCMNSSGRVEPELRRNVMTAAQSVGIVVRVGSPVV